MAGLLEQINTNRDVTDYLWYMTEFNEEMMKSLFGYTDADKYRIARSKESSETSIQYIQIIDPRKARNLSIILKALNLTTTKVVATLQEEGQAIAIFKLRPRTSSIVFLFVTVVETSQ